MPSATASASAVVKNGIIYVIGGYANGGRTTNVESYNPANDTWTAEAPLMVGKSLPAAGLLGSTIVAAGGLDNSGVTGDNEGYNSSTNMWSDLTSDPTARQATCSAAISGLLYSAGGSGAGNFGDPLSVLESFSATTKKWTTLTSMPQAVLGPGSAVVNLATNGVANNMLYCFGGSNDGRLGQGTVYNYVQIYQP
jgi:N-acetylneuraminic acid mutarotase